MYAPVPASTFIPDFDRPYLVFCPDQGGWHVGEWWVIDGPPRWVLALDVDVDLTVSHIMELPAPPMEPHELVQWTLAKEMAPTGRN